MQNLPQRGAKDARGVGIWPLVALSAPFRGHSLGRGARLVFGSRRAARSLARGNRNQKQEGLFDAGQFLKRVKYLQSRPSEISVIARYNRQIVAAGSRSDIAVFDRHEL